MNEKNVLRHKDLHISGLLNVKKRTFTPRKWTLKICFQKKGRVFSIKTAMYVRRLFEKFRYDEMFGRSALMEVIDLKKVQRIKASLQISAGGYYRASICHRKGKYKFKK